MYTIHEATVLIDPIPQFCYNDHLLFDKLWLISVKAVMIFVQICFFLLSLLSQMIRFVYVVCLLVQCRRFVLFFFFCSMLLLFINNCWKHLCEYLNVRVLLSKTGWVSGWQRASTKWKKDWGWIENGVTDKNTNEIEESKEKRKWINSKL